MNVKMSKKYTFTKKLAAEVLFAKPEREIVPSKYYIYICYFNFVKS